MTELVYLKNDEAVCDSLQVAEKFHKEHRNVLQNIDNLIAENSAVQNMFRQSHYKSRQWSVIQEVLYEPRWLFASGNGVHR